MEWQGKIGLVPVECIFPLFPNYVFASKRQTPWFLGFVALFNVIPYFLEIVLKINQKDLFSNNFMI